MSEIPRFGNLNQGNAEEADDGIDSIPYFGATGLDSEQGVVLKDWSAQDFANIYVRFRPQLVLYAHKFLGEELQAEEVVHDAFLYLMTALPELDSEPGVLRFLKWKIKMLCYDISRSADSRLSVNVANFPEDIASNLDPSDRLIRADDAAIVQLALARLSSRHREVLVATLYEEKSHDEVALQMGMDKNALRQLLFRARASFREALVGEAAVEGKTLSEILSLAMRHHRKSARTVSSLVLLLCLYVAGLGFLPVLNSDLVSSSQVSIPTLGDVDLGRSVPQTERATLDPAATSGDGADSAEKSADVVGLTEQNEAVLYQGQKEVSNDAFVQTPSRVNETEGPSEAEGNFERARGLLGQNLVETLAVSDFDLMFSESRGSQWTTLEVQSSSGLRGSLGFALEDSPRVDFAWFNVVLDEVEFALVPRTIVVTSGEELAADRLSCATFVFTDFVAGSTNGKLGSIATAETFVARNALILEVCFDEATKQILRSNLVFTNKT